MKTCLHCCPLGGILLAWFVSNQYNTKFTLTYSNLSSYAETSISVLMGGWSHPHLQRARTYCIVWWVWKGYKSCPMVFTFTRSQCSWTPRGVFGVMCWWSSPPPLPKHPLREYLLEESFSSFPYSSLRLVEPIPRYSSCSLWWHLINVYFL